ncbi:MAG: 30S ribosomal protein S15 [Candidatus Bathyarchaeia archaeon]
MPKKPKGKSHSNRPISKRVPAWCKYQPEEVEALIIKLTKEGHNPSMIGNILRDQYGIPLVKVITGKSITQIQKEAGLQPSIPEDLQFLIQKAGRIKRHLERNKDLHNRRALQIVESKIRSLANYYIRRKALPEGWSYATVM